MEDTEIVERYLRADYRKEIGELRRFASKSFTIDYKTIKPNSVADLVLSSNWSATLFFKDALRRIGVEEKILTPLQIRYINLPILPIRNMKSEFINQTRAFEGIVRRVSEVKSKATVAIFECSYCTKKVSVPQGIDITYPEGKCEWCERTVKWKVTSDGTFTDFQTIVVQEFPESIAGGDQPKSITVTLLGDLCSQVIPGNRITVVGTLKLKKVKSDAGLIFEPYMEGNSIIINDETYDDIKVTEEDLSEITALSKTPSLLEVLSSSIAPTIYGNEEVKQGITLQMFGGSPKQIENTRIRPDIHVLLIGDPSTAKSAIMKHVISIVPRGVFTLGYSASKAGLTATAVKDEDGQWVLDAGALVLANNGMCAVDELDKMNDNDRVALHGAMEQQEIDIAKAGIVAKLYTRCSLLAGANPKLGRFDNFQSLSQQFDLEPTLLSRFDLIYPIEDKPEQTRDSAIAKHILNTHMTQTVKKGSVAIPLFKKYISHARTINPVLTPEAASMIEEYYTKVRGLANNMNTVPITARSLEALIRLSEAAARMRLSDTVTPDDAKVVITIVDGCLKKIAYDSKTKTWDLDKIVNRYSKKSANVIGRLTDAIITLGDEKGVAKTSDVSAYMKEHYNISEDETLSHVELMRQETRLLSPRDGYIKVFK